MTRVATLSIGESQYDDRFWQILEATGLEREEFEGLEGVPGGRRPPLPAGVYAGEQVRRSAEVEHSAAQQDALPVHVHEGAQQPLQPYAIARGAQPNAEAAERVGELRGRQDTHAYWVVGWRKVAEVRRVVVEYRLDVGQAV